MGSAWSNCSERVAFGVLCQGFNGGRSGGSECDSVAVAVAYNITYHCLVGLCCLLRWLTTVCQAPHFARVLLVLQGPEVKGRGCGRGTGGFAVVCCCSNSRTTCPALTREITSRWIKSLPLVSYRVCDWHGVCAFVLSCVCVWCECAGTRPWALAQLLVCDAQCL